MQHQRLASAAALLADPSRAAMVLALMDGRSRSAKKLALDAGITPQTASSHLRKLVCAHVLVWEGRGRTKEFSLAGPDVAQAVEALSDLNTRPLPAAARELRYARCCYDHLAGQLGVGLTQALIANGALRQEERQFEVTPAGADLLEDFGIDLETVRAHRRGFAPLCLDWSERLPHVAGSLGAALLTALFDRGWIKRTSDSRAVTVTLAGRRGLERTFGLKSAAP